MSSESSVRRGRAGRQLDRDNDVFLNRLPTGGRSQPICQPKKEASDDQATQAPQRPKSGFRRHRSVSSQTPYLVPAHAGVQIGSILSVGDQVGVKEAPAALAGQPWRMVGIPDGLGAFDNGDGTMTVLMNHELGQAVGVVRAHGSTGAFVSKLTVDMTTHQVLDATDLSEDVFLFNRCDQCVRGDDDAIRTVVLGRPAGGVRLL